MIVFRPPPRIVLKAASSKLEQVIDRLAPKMERAIRQAALRAQGRIDLEVMAANIEAGRVGRAIDQLKLETFVAEDLAPTMEFLVEANEAGSFTAIHTLNQPLKVFFSVRTSGTGVRKDGVKLPMFHGTSDKVADKIKREGIRAATDSSNNPVVWLTPHPVKAQGYSGADSTRFGGVVFEVTIPSDKIHLLQRKKSTLPGVDPDRYVFAGDIDPKWITVQAKTNNVGEWEDVPRTSSSFPLGIDLKTTNPRALASAEAQAARLLTAVNEETKQTVRDLIARAYREQITTKDTARLIRDVVGLNDRQATALFNYRAGLVEDGRAADQVERMTARYGDRLLRDRAKTIAQTEVHRASAEGQHELWREGVREGRINPTTARRIWIANVGACEVCEAIEEMNSDGVPIDGDFETPDGLISGPEESHVGCRCSTGLEME